MRQLLLAGTAVAVVMTAGAAGAADMARPLYKAPPPVPVFTWTGWYVGVHVGGAWGTKEWQDPSGAFFSGSVPSGIAFSFPDTTINNYGVNGFLGGVQIGYNYQSGPWVWGVEAQASLGRHSRQRPLYRSLLYRQSRLQDQCRRARKLRPALWRNHRPRHAVREGRLGLGLRAAQGLFR
jgi:opacity protein-like surface antigen